LLIVVAAAAGILVLRHRKAIADFIVERNRRLFGVNLNASQAPKSMLVVGCGFLGLSLAMLVITATTLLYP